jgi:hypothetical protein
MPNRKIALDPGFGGFKAAEVQGDEIRIVNLPSVVGAGDTDLGMLSLAGVTGRKRRRNLPKRVTFEGVDRLVGPNVADYARPVERLDFERLSNGPELRALAYAALFGIVDDDQADINLVIGLPIEVLQGPGAKDTVKSLRGWLLGQHNFAVNDQPVALNIHRIRPVAQPVGSFFDWGLDHSGQWTRSTDDFKLPVGILDLGFNTLDLFSVQEGEISVRYTGGDTLGMRRAATYLKDNVQRQHQRSLSLHQADELLREYIKGRGRKQVKLPVAGGTADMRAQVRSALDYTAGEVTAFVEQVWGNGRQFSNLLLTGGGSLALKDQLQRQIPHAIFSGDDPVTANARGLAKLAQRRGLFG